MLAHEPESGMCRDQPAFSYSKRQTPELDPPKEVSEKLYVGHLPFAISKRELDELFGRFGPLANIEIKHGGYAFIQYGMIGSLENPRDAEESVKVLHNFLFEGRRLTVEFSNKKGTGGNACLLCGVEGHWARECPDNKEKGLDVKSGKCFKCGGFGHLARFCRDAKVSDRPLSPQPRFRPGSPKRRRSRSPYRYDYHYRRRSPSPYYRGRYSPPPMYHPRDYPYYRYEDEYRYRERDYYDRESEGRMDRDERGDLPRDLPRDGRDLRMDAREAREARMDTRDMRDVPRDPRDIREVPRDPRDIRDVPREMSRDPREVPRDPRDPRMEERDPRNPRVDYYYRDQYKR